MARMFLLKSLLEEAHALDNLEKRHQSARIRCLSLLTRDDDYVSIYRLSKELIDQLESDLLPLIKPTKRRGKELTTRVKILCTLSFLASGSYQKVIKEGIRTYLSQPSASRCINEVVEALNNPAVVKKYIRFPQNQQERQIGAVSIFFRRMRRVAEFKRDNASLLDNLLPEQESVAFLEHKVVNVLKGRDHKGRRVLVVNVGGSWDPKKVNADQLFKLFYLIHEAAMLEPESQVRGTVVIMDFYDMGWTQTMGLTPAFSKRLLTFIQDAMPLRLKEVHFVKQPMIFNVVWNMFKPFIREKLKNRIFFHGSKMSSLHKHMAPSHLPADYGGELPAIDYSGAEWYPVINDVLPHIHNWNTYGFAKK